MRCFSPVWYISTFKRSLHSILHAGRSAYVFQRQKKPRNSKIPIIRRFWRKLCVISLSFIIFRRLNAHFTPFYMQNAVHTFSSAETSPETQNRNRNLEALCTPCYIQNVVHAFCSIESIAETRHHSSILTKIMRYCSPVWDISTFKRSFYSILHAGRSPPDLQRRNMPVSSPNSIIRRFWRKLYVISFSFEIFRR